MTPGHKHRTIHMTEGRWLLHLLQTPLVVTADRERAEQSRWTWAPGGVERITGDGPHRYVNTFALTPLGILHALTGLTIQTEREVHKR